MSKKVRVLAFAGSARKDSFNKKLVNQAAAGARQVGAEVTVLDLHDYPMPLFNEDLEAAEGMPENVKKVKQMFVDHDGLLIASPEYNSSISPLLKNTLDWVSRAESEEEAPLAAYSNKVATIMSASPGGLGGLRGLVHLRAILENIGVIVLPKQRAVSGAYSAFADDGTISDERQQQAVLALGQGLAEFLQKLQ